MLLLSQTAIGTIPTHSNMNLLNKLNRLREIATTISALSPEALEIPCPPETSFKIKRSVKKIIEDTIDEPLTEPQFEAIVEKKSGKTKDSYYNLLSLILTVIFGVSGIISDVNLLNATNESNILHQKEISLQQEANDLSRKIIETNKELIDAVNRLADTLE